MASLESMLTQAVAAGRLPQLNLVRCEIGYQASVARPGNRSSWAVAVKPTAVEALTAVLASALDQKPEPSPKEVVNYEDLI